MDDDNLIRALKNESLKFERKCKEVAVYHNSSSQVPRSALAVNFDIQSIRLVNSTHILTLSIDCEYGINCIRELAMYLKVACISPKMASKIFFKVDNFTLSISLKTMYTVFVDGEKRSLQIVGANLAGCCAIETVISLGWELSKIFHRSSNKMRVNRIGYQLVNNVIILDVGGNSLDVEKLVSKKMDKLKTYNPNKFPGATFTVTKFMDCRILIAFTTCNFSLLGCINPSDLYSTLWQRLPIIRECQTDCPISRDSRARHRTRVDLNHTNQAVSEEIKPKKKKSYTQQQQQDEKHPVKKRKIER